MLSSKLFPRIGNDVKNLLQHERKISLTFHRKVQNFRNLPATYGGRHTVTLLPADGIGPATINGMRDVFVAAGVPIDFHTADLEGKTNAERRESFNEVLMAVKRNGIAVKGNWVTEVDDLELGPIGDVSYNVMLRHKLDLYANVVQCKSIPNVNTRHNNVDLVVVRENTEGEYSNLEHENVPGVIEMMKIVTESSSKRIAKFAFEYAETHGRKKVTSVHKANIMKLSDGLFLQCCREVAKDYPNIEFNDMIVDNCAMQLVSKPEQFDVMVTPNLYGNVVSTIAASLIGGPGLPSGANYGDDIVVYESGTRNSGQGIAHLNIANPMSILFAGTNMLVDLGLHQHSELINECIENVVSTGKARTMDIGGDTKTTEFIEILVDEIETVRQQRFAASR